MNTANDSRPGGCISSHRALSETATRPQEKFHEHAIA